MGKFSQTLAHMFYAVLWLVLKGISTTRSPVEIPFRALVFVGFK